MYTSLFWILNENLQGIGNFLCIISSFDCALAFSISKNKNTKLSLTSKKECQVVRTRSQLSENTGQTMLLTILHSLFWWFPQRYSQLKSKIGDESNKGKNKQVFQKQKWVLTRLAGIEKKNAFQNNNKRKYFWIERNDRPIFLRKNSGKTNIFFYFKKFFKKLFY